jgi:SAM-dependent methyltransferase
VNYDGYASIYDGSGQIRFALLTAIYLEDVLAAHPVAGRQLLDVACGTGTLALLMEERGWQVTGLDAAPAMLAQARAKAAASGSAARWIHGNMADLEQLVAPASCDLVTCTYDSLNYLTAQSALQRLLRGLAHVLRPGGLGYFDINTEHFLAHDWGECSVSRRHGLYQIEQSGFDPDSCSSTLLLTAFVGDDLQGYQRIDEVHIERAYPRAVVAAALQAAGLVIEAVYDGFTRQAAHAAAQRECWVVRRPAEGVS